MNCTDNTYEAEYTYDGQGRKLRATYQKKVMDIVAPARPLMKTLAMSSRFEGLGNSKVRPETIIQDTIIHGAPIGDYSEFSQTDYCGNIIYRGNRATVLNAHGYTNIDTDAATGESTATHYYYLKDHLGTAGKVAANAALSGVVAEIGGGKFASGAMTGAFIMMYNELSHKYIVRRTIKIKTPAQIPFDMNPATDANISLEIKISIQELHYPNGDLTINGYATACNSGNLNITTSLDMNIVMDSDVRNVTFKRQYFGFELSQKGFIPIGEVHENIYNISSYKHIDVNLHPHWAVFNGSLGNVVPTIPGTFNLIPVEYITSKQYRIK